MRVHANHINEIQMLARQKRIVNGCSALLEIIYEKKKKKKTFCRKKVTKSKKKKTKQNKT